MKKHFILPLLLFTLIVFTNAQTTTIEKQIDNVSETSLKANLYKLQAMNLKEEWLPQKAIVLPFSISLLGLAHMVW